MYKVYCLILIFLFIFLTSISAEDYFIVKSNNIKIYSSNSIKSKVIKLINKNERVLKLSEKNNFFQIKTEGKIIGWIYSSYLTKEILKQNKDSKNVFDALTTDDYTSRNTSTSANVRGLSEISKTYAASKHITDKAIETVKDMENYKISDNELDKFSAEGKLAEYAE